MYSYFCALFDLLNDGEIMFLSVFLGPSRVVMELQSVFVSSRLCKYPPMLMFSLV